MVEQNKNLVLDNGEKSALTFVLIDWLNVEKEEENHVIHGEIVNIYQKVIAL
jgi:hypothetical protein